VGASATGDSAEVISNPFKIHLETAGQTGVHARGREEQGERMPMVFFRPKQRHATYNRRSKEEAGSKKLRRGTKTSGDNVVRSGSCPTGKFAQTKPVKKPRVALLNHPQGGGSSHKSGYGNSPSERLEDWIKKSGTGPDGAIKLLPTHRENHHRVGGTYLLQ